ncbi:MAG: ABC transporter permease [Pseudomonadota bacterium]
MAAKQHLRERSSADLASSQPTHSLTKMARLTFSLVRREVQSRYRGSALGLIWSMVTPVLMLGVYTFVFGVVFKSRWTTSSEDAAPIEFAVILFIGLIVFQLMSETVIRAPTLIQSNVAFVKKVVFPLEVLVPVALGTALFHALVSLFILLPFIYFVFGHVPITGILLPLVWLPFLLLVAGLSWFLASLGTFVRDIGQFVGTVVTALLFLAPVFFPLSALPEWLQPWLILNPITIPIDQSRQVLIFGELPDWGLFGSYSAAGLITCLIGFFWFQRTRKGFADVL